MKDARAFRIFHQEKPLFLKNVDLTISIAKMK